MGRLTGGDCGESVQPMVALEGLVKGWQIFVHSVRQVFGNIRAAVLITALPMLVSVTALYVLKLKFLLVPFQFALALQRGLIPWPKVAALLIVVQLMFVWAAVNWHRHILREEPVGFGLPPLHIRLVWSYFLATLFLSIAVILPTSILNGVLLGIPAGFAKALHSETALIVGTLIFAIPILMTSTIMLRAAIYLPGIALGQKTRLRDGWDASRLQLMALTILVFLMGLTFIGVAYVGKIKALYPTTSLGLMWSFIGTWFKTMLGLSLLTTLYGHYVEKRPLV